MDTEGRSLSKKQMQCQHFLSHEDPVRQIEVYYATVNREKNDCVTLSPLALKQIEGLRRDLGKRFLVGASIQQLQHLRETDTFHRPIAVVCSVDHPPRSGLFMPSEVCRRAKSTATCYA